MKKLLENDSPVGKLPTGTMVTGVIKDINPPPATDATKQPITLMWPGTDLELRCNVIGEHIHIAHTLAGKVVTITAQKDSALYVSKFDDGNRFLTIRDGVTMSYRDPAPGSVPGVMDRVDLLISHYFAVRAKVVEAIPGCKEEEIQKTAMAIWLDTKSQAKPPALPSTEPEAAEPAIPEPIATENQVANVVSMEESMFIMKAAAAMAYVGDEPVKLQFRDAFMKAADSIQSSRSASSPKKPIWSEILFAASNNADSKEEKAIDEQVSRVDGAFPEKPQMTRDRAVCLSIRAKLLEG